VKFHHLVKFMTIPTDRPIELMYRQPGLPNHQNITDVLDEIILKLREIENRLSKLEN
jgi:hypothetical protein